MLVLPADHLIANVGRFHEVLRVAVKAAQGDGERPAPLVTIGIRPTHPETGYGYVQFDADGDHDGVRDDGPLDKPRAHQVLTFAEKPDLATAERFLDAGDFLWNSGMFIWRADAILAALRALPPDGPQAVRAARRRLRDRPRGRRHRGRLRPEPQDLDRLRHPGAGRLGAGRAGLVRLERRRRLAGRPRALRQGRRGQPGRGQRDPEGHGPERSRAARTAGSWCWSGWRTRSWSTRATRSWCATASRPRR